MARLALRLIGTTDLHARAHPHDYYRDAPDPTTGLAKAGGLIAEARAQARNALLFDNGDLLQGSPLGDWAAEAMQARKLDLHPMIAAMNALRYDAATVGNHDFNYGLETLDRALDGARFPFLCCNVLKPDGSPYFEPWRVLRRRLHDAEGSGHQVGIGVIGFVTPEIVRWDRSRLTGRVSALGIVEAARRHLPALRAAGADLVVALCHSGISRNGAAGAEENAGLELARVGGIEALFVGHQHLSLPGPDFAGLEGVDAERGALANVPAAMPGFWGRQIGVIDLELETADWRVIASRSQLRRVEPETAAEPAALEAAASAHAQTLSYVRAPVGVSAEPLASHFAMIGDAGVVRVVHDAQLWYARHALGLDGILLSAAAPFKCGGRAGPDNYTHVPQGPISLRHVADLYVFPNTLCVVKATGALLREWLERSACVFAQVDPQAGAPQPLLSPDCAAYDFDSIAGVSYRIDPTQPARYDAQGRLVAPQARRIVDLKLAGEPLDDRAEFLVVTNSYRANGGGHFPGCDGASILMEAPDSNFDALLRYVRAQPRLAASPGAAWRLAPWSKAATAYIEAPPSAAEFAPPPGVGVAPLERGAGRFWRFRVIPED